MKKMNRALRLLGYLVVVLAVVAMLGFVESTKSVAVCEGMEIEFVGGDSVRLITENDVRQTILNKVGEPVGMNLRGIDFDGMEELLRSLPHLRHVAVYSTVDQHVRVEIEQRRPMVRLLDRNGKSAVVDCEGVIMPVPNAAVLRLPVFTGDFGLTQEQIDQNFPITDTTATLALMNAYEFGRCIKGDSFAQAQFQHMVMEKNGNLTAYPQVGNHTIIFGKNDFEEKLRRLKIFYREGMTANNWNKYSSINLKYKNQIVCTKK